jgi:hypothetical protein
MTLRTSPSRPCVDSPRQITDRPIPTARLQYLVEQIHALGPYPLSDLLAEIIGGARGITGNASPRRSSTSSARGAADPRSRAEAVGIGCGS